MYELYLKYIKEFFPEGKNIYLCMFLMNVLFGYILARLNYSLIMSIAIDLLLINIVENRIIKQYVEKLGIRDNIESKKKIIDDLLSNKFILTKDLIGITLGWIIGKQIKK